MLLIIATVALIMGVLIIGSLRAAVVALRGLIRGDLRPMIPLVKWLAAVGVFAICSTTVALSL